MGVFTDVEEFLQEHRPHGDFTFWTIPPTAKGYQVHIACPCGVVFERWVFPDDADEDLLRSGLLAFPN